ncbi:MAG: hypothetical protein IJ691_00990 [Lachnospiraceae bacterium]|nr:hypothetical protein [Lachnospiraceae bacterium]
MNTLNPNTKSSSVPGFYRFADTFGRWFFLLFSAILAVTACFSTAFITDISSQIVLFKTDLPWPNVFIVALLVFLFYLFGKLFGKDSALRDRLFLFLSLIVIFVLGSLLAVFGRSVPAADGMTVYYMAEMASTGDLSFITGSDSYLSFYPHQIGFVTFLALPIKLWNMLGTSLDAFHMLKIINCFMACGAVLFQYFTLKRICPDKLNKSYVCNTYLLLVVLNVPFIMYTSFVYGEMPSVFALSAAIYFLSLFIGKVSGGALIKKQIPSAIGVILFSTLAVFFRKNCLVFVIALSIVLVAELIKTKKPIIVLVLVLTVVCSLEILPLTIKVYEGISGGKLFSGVTPTSYFAMGMQEAERGCGYYNGFNYITYEESGFNTDLANKISRDAILERLEYFKEHPDYTIRFYLKKYLSQWSDGTYSVRQSTWAESGGRIDPIQKIYTGTYGKYLVNYCDAYQLLIYLGTFLFFLRSVISRKKGKEPYSFSVLLGIIFIFGCFLFHMAWEANSRYIFPCSVFFLPYAAMGLCNYKTSYK